MDIPININNCGNESQKDSPNLTATHHQKMTKSERTFVRSLHQKKYRYATGRFLIEGIKPVLEAINAGFPLDKIYTTSVQYHNIPASSQHLLENIKAKIHFIETADIQHISTLKTPEGLAAIGIIPNHSLPANGLRSSRAIYLWEINDPGNLGTILRTACWFGLREVILSPNSVDVYSPKVVRSSMGALFNLCCYQNISLKPLIEIAKSKKYQILAADNSGTKVILPENQPWILVLGNETHGIPQILKAKATHIIGIPRYGKGDSLNLSVATGILLAQLIQKAKE
jgi:TrmH family RNA methyltransferase